VERLLALCGLAGRALERRAHLQREIALGYRLSSQGRPGPLAEASLPGGMLEALCIAGALGRDTAALDLHYTRSMPALLAQQLAGQGRAASLAGRYQRLFTTRLLPRKLPRLMGALEALFALVAQAGVPCERALGASTPTQLLALRPTLGALYASAHFGSSMPMLYAYPGDLAALPDGDLEAWLDRRLTGPLVHELSHLQPSDPDLVPAPANLHEALAGWLGSEAMPEQMAPAEGGLDALPGGPWFAAVGAWVARACGPQEAIRAQAGLADLRDLLGPRCSEALRLFGWLQHLDTSAPHLLADTFRADRWWKLIDLHRDPVLERAFQNDHVLPLLAAPPPPPGTGLSLRWAEALDRLHWRELPAWRAQPEASDLALARRAAAALHTRAQREGATFRVEAVAPPPHPCTGKRTAGSGPLSLEVETCLLRSGYPGPDAVGAPPCFPFPPALAAALSREGIDEWRTAREIAPELAACSGVGGRES
jgi:hypothetical protein